LNHSFYLFWKIFARAKGSFELDGAYLQDKNQ